MEHQYWTIAQTVHVLPKGSVTIVIGVAVGLCNCVVKNSDALLCPRSVEPLWSNDVRFARSS